jgi:hypothetical protein
MDEVDGMSAGDRGGVVALKALIKKTRVCAGRLQEKLNLTCHSDTHYLHCE